MISRIPGTHDILDLRQFTALTNIIREHFQQASYREIMMPLIEPTELFHRSLGGATDIMSKELYFVHSPHSSEGDTTLCLRPEATASAMRAFLNANITNKPWSVFTIGPMFRHERPQKGRYRQFHQASMEVIGATSIAQDAWLISLFDRLFTERLSMNNYNLLLNFMGCTADRVAFAKILQTWLEQHAAQLCSTCIHRTTTNPLRVFDCKTASCQKLFADGPHTTDHLCEACTGEWLTLQKLLTHLSVNFVHQPLLVRGLDYYTKTVFEFVSLELGAQNTFCGGGRYNQLARDIGAPEDIPSVGGAIGIERLLLLVGDTLNVRTQPLHCIIPLSAEQHSLALQLSELLHAKGVTIQALFDGNIKQMMRAADRAGAQRCLLLGPDEQAAGTVALKNMQTGTTEQIPQRDIVEHLQKMA